MKKRKGKPAPKYVGDVKQEHVLAAICANFPELRREGWKAASIAAFKDLEDATDDLVSLIQDLPFIPDAFAIDATIPELRFFEVEVHSPMPGNKLRRYAKFGVALDFYGVTFALFAVNKHGNINQVDLAPHYQDALKEDRDGE